MEYLLLGFLGLAALFLGFLFWNKPTLLIYAIILFCFVSDLFVSFLHIPESIRYVADLLSIYLMVIGVVLMLIKPHKLYANVPFILIGIMVLIAVMSYVVNEYRFVSFGVGVFQFFRGFCFFIACICVLKKEDVERLTKWFIFAAFANLLVSLFEYFVLHQSWDNNGGLFGTIVGCNGKMNLFMVLAITIAAVLYMNKKLSVWLTIGVMLCCLIAATVSELKIFYLEFILCIVLVVLFSKPNKKTIGFLLGGGIAVWIGVMVLGKMYPNFEDFFSLEAMLEYATEDYGTSKGSLNRLSGVFVMLSDYLRLPVQKVFGLGLGNAHVGTSFYNQYEYLKYIFFYSSYVVTEVGITGLVTLVGFYIVNAVVSLRFFFQKKEGTVYFLIAATSSVMSVVLMIYDTSLISVTSYLMYFWLAVPYIMMKRPKEQ